MSPREDFSHLPVWLTRQTADKAGVCTICSVRMEKWGQRAPRWAAIVREGSSLRAPFPILHPPLLPVGAASYPGSDVTREM